ncbi:MAG: hypothetical protein ABIO70_13655 [Pseudomonadota bacterium]
MSKNIPTCIIALALVACRLGLEDRGHPPPPGMQPTSTAQPVQPLAASAAGEEALYQVLYAGEIGERSGALGDRVRALAFLRVLKLDTTQLQGLQGLLTAHWTLLEDERRAREATDIRELKAYGAAYHELLGLLERPEDPPDATLARIAHELTAARGVAATDAERGDHFRRIHGHLGQVRTWVETLDRAQQDRLHTCLFLLRRRLGPFTAPGDYGELVSPLWQGGDFASLARTARPADERPLDLALLWSLEDTDGKHQLHLRGLQLQALVFMALDEPALAEAVATQLALLTGPDLPPGEGGP